MVEQGWDQRFFASTRGQIVKLLHRADRTVDEIAQELGITGNAVRAQLTALERDGLVRQSGVQRRSRKPAFSYSLTPAAGRLFPRPYGLVLGHVIDALVDRLSGAELEVAMRAAAHDLAINLPRPSGDLGERMAAVAEAITSLGGLIEVEEHDGAFAFRGLRCPLGLVAPGRPLICLFVESLLSEVVGAPVRQHCDRTDPARCYLKVS